LDILPGERKALDDFRDGKDLELRQKVRLFRKLLEPLREKYDYIFIVDDQMQAQVQIESGQLPQSQVNVLTASEQEIIDALKYIKLIGKDSTLSNLRRWLKPLLTTGKPKSQETYSS
jgi:hypothetical protein